ncbi:MAG: hypothetical protein DMF84_28600 [Acidobacteria bacterium]|nr:MAG: hypothetical protein DMF84_28600 [Acidobacteriota bacterium]
MRRLLAPDGGPGYELEAAIAQIESLSLAGAISPAELQAVVLLLQNVATRRQDTRRGTPPNAPT